MFKISINSLSWNWIAKLSTFR